jgi:hypothetical protein
MKFPVTEKEEAWKLVVRVETNGTHHNDHRQDDSHAIIYCTSEQISSLLLFIKISSAINFFLTKLEELRPLQGFIVYKKRFKRSTKERKKQQKEEEECAIKN